MSKTKILLYCTKAKPFISYDDYDKSFWISITDNKCENYHLNGKIVAECECEKVDYYEMEFHKNNFVLNQIGIYNELESNEWGHDCFDRVISNENSDEEIANCPLIKDSCLTFNELGQYVCPKGGINNFYAIHLSNVEMLDKPLSIEKDYIYTHYSECEYLKKPPQNMCGVYDRFGNYYILISIQPQHLVHILNGKKTIEIRKSIMNVLKESDL